MANDPGPPTLNGQYEDLFSLDPFNYGLNMSSDINNMAFGGINDSPLSNHLAFGDKDIPFNLQDVNDPAFLEDLNVDDVIDEYVWSDAANASAAQDTEIDVAETPKKQDVAMIEQSEVEGVQDKDGESEHSPKPRRELRPQARQSKGGFITTWVDQDDTGDFDPSEENRQAYHRRNRMRLRQRAAPTCQAKPHCKRDAAASGAQAQLIVKLQLQSDSAAIRFAQLVRDLPCQPPPSSDSAETYGYSLRKRAHSIQFTYNDNYDRKRKHAGANDIPEDPTGHPFARGCWACVSLGHDCSLLEDEASWPCTTCIEDDTECDLVVPPERKRACERCKSRKTSCSYSYTLNHGSACQQCMDIGSACLAGPAKDFIRTRMRYDRDWTKDPLPVEKAPRIKSYLGCADCREAERGCSFETDGNCGLGGMPCTQCVAAGSQCWTTSQLPQQEAKAQRSDVVVVEKAAEEEEKVQMPPPRKPAKAHNHKPLRIGKPRQISTKLCHPIIFNHNDSAPGQGPCHFCADAAYGLLGLEKRKVKVIDWNDGRGLEEVSGGHRGEGIESTRMCPSCTLNRLAVILCPGHRMEQIPGSKADHDAALMDLLSGNVQKGRHWCAVCPTPATYACCAPGDEDIRGCGLMLCQHCTRVLTASHGEDLQAMLSKVTDEPSEQKPLGLRADYELLKQDGLLLRYVLSNN